MSKSNEGSQQERRRTAASTGLLACVIIACLAAGCGLPPAPPGGNDNTTAKSIAVIGYNELGMHCMNRDFSELMLLPPYNNLRVQVIQRSAEEPRILTSGVTVRYSLPGNTHSSDKTNFWTYANALLGVNLAPDVGLAGNGLSGTMVTTGENDWVAVGIPVTPMGDDGVEDAYPLAKVSVEQNGVTIVENADIIVPVSWEIHCDLCHTATGMTVDTNILQAHDLMHGTTLEASKPVLCAGCHADPALGAAGKPGVSTMSRAMHHSHASRMSPAGLSNECYGCHPGVETQCLRDVHLAHGMTCTDCHLSMDAVGGAGRRPWVDEPRCGTCHNKPGFQYEQPNTLYRQSKGHGGVHCAACHGSPHAITPTVTSKDNQQAMALQGHSGVIDTCTVCHAQRPDESFFHRLGE